MAAKKRKIKWKVHNQELAGRGSITFLFSKEMDSSWYNSEASGRGGFQRVYSDTAIEILSLIRSKYKMPLRSVQGFAQSFFKLAGFGDIKIPHFSTLSRRFGSSGGVRPRGGRGKPGKAKGSLYVVADSSGLKVFGKKGWKARQHAYSKRGAWRKLRLCADERSSGALSVTLVNS